MNEDRYRYGHKCKLLGYSVLYSLAGSGFFLSALCAEGIHHFPVPTAIVPPDIHKPLKKNCNKLNLIYSI